MRYGIGLKDDIQQNLELDRSLKYFINRKAPMAVLWLAEDKGYGLPVQSFPDS